MSRVTAGLSKRAPRLMGYRDLAAMIRRSSPRCGKVRLVAVDGSGGAGKSVFARRLALSLGGVPVVHTDDFASWENPLDWWDRFEETILGPLAHGGLVKYQAYDSSGHPFGDWQEIPISDVVIVEGVSSSRQAAVDVLTVAIWIDTPLDERMARGIARDGESMRPAWEQWIAAEDVHFARDRTRERADVIVEGAPLVPHDPEEEFVALFAPRMDLRPAPR